MPPKFSQMNWKVIKTERQYKRALVRLEQIFDARKNTRLGDELELLSLLVEAYEKERYSIETPDPIEAIKFRMEQSGLTVKDLVPSIGQPNRVYEVLNGKRGLTLEMILNDLATRYGWEELGRRIDIRCFNQDPSIASSLKVLRKTPWAREKVEGLYLYTLRQSRRQDG